MWHDVMILPCLWAVSFNKERTEPKYNVARRPASIVPSVGRSEARLVLLLQLDWRLGLVLMLLLPELPRAAPPAQLPRAATVGSEPELSSEFSSMLVSLEAVFRKLLTASLFFSLVRSLSCSKELVTTLPSKSNLALYPRSNLAY